MAQLRTRNDESGNYIVGAEGPSPYDRELSANYGHASHKCQHALVLLVMSINCTGIYLGESISGADPGSTYP